ncbi:DinB family protein [Nocardioides sp. URHA0020]|uniref:DinB family protein n=1 Tax=Nocardioides sp. URHA0020 TaxID=1380392 RepID=UPI00048FE69E|nr:DinB family protein [Nocardioides sp. URHA0020]
MVELSDRDLTGSRFRTVDLSGSRFSDVNLSGALLRGAWADRLELDGAFGALVVNGVDVMPFVLAEMDRLDPERPLMRPEDADGFRVAWPIIEQRWAETVERARRLPPDLVHERVDEEWSFIETLRHLVMATDAWVLRALLGEPAPYHPLGLPHSEMDPSLGLPRDLDARPGLDEVLAIRADRMATVGAVIAELSDERLDAMTEPVLDPGYPERVSHPVRRCLGAVLSEEWEHRRFAERDLAVLEERASAVVTVTPDR